MIRLNTAFKYVICSYTVAALVVVYDLNTKEQFCVDVHDNDVTCIAVHPSGKFVASAQVISYALFHMLVDNHDQELVLLQSY